MSPVMSELPLDDRWTKAQRQRYDRAVRAGRFGECLAIIETQMTPEQRAAATARGKELCDRFAEAHR